MVDAGGETSDEVDKRGRTLRRPGMLRRFGGEFRCRVRCADDMATLSYRPRSLHDPCRHTVAVEHWSSVITPCGWLWSHFQPVRPSYGIASPVESRLVWVADLDEWYRKISELPDKPGMSVITRRLFAVVVNSTHAWLGLASKDIVLL